MAAEPTARISTRPCRSFAAILIVAHKLVDMLISDGTRPQSLAWALAELDQLQAVVKEITMRRGAA